MMTISRERLKRAAALIEDGMCWRTDTEEGYTYWDTVRDKLKKLARDPEKYCEKCGSKLTSEE